MQENKEKRKLIVYIAMSLDGFIADKDNNIDFLSTVENEGEDYGYFEFLSSVDTVIIGRKSFEKVESFGIPYPHTDKEVYIFSRKKRPQSGSFSWCNEDPAKLVRKLKTREGKNIYCDGGAEIVNALLKQNLVDEMIISVIPVLLGSGIRLFHENQNQKKLDLIAEKSYPAGLVQLHYSFG